MKNRKPKHFTKPPKVINHTVGAFTDKLTGKTYMSIRLTKDFYPYYSKDLSGYGINKTNPSYRGNSAFVNKFVHIGIESGNVTFKQIARNITTQNEWKYWSDMAHGYNIVRQKEGMLLS